MFFPDFTAATEKNLVTLLVLLISVLHSSALLINCEKDNFKIFRSILDRFILKQIIYFPNPLTV
jgi:hypothetical protein